MRQELTRARVGCGTRDEIRLRPTPIAADQDTKHPFADERCRLGTVGSVRAIG